MDSIEGIDDLVAAAMTKFEGYIREHVSAYERRTEARWHASTPTVCFLGHGRSGKDEAAAHLGARSSLTYVGSVSKIVLPLVAHAQELPEATAWDCRHHHRKFWFNFCNGIRKEDPTLLVKMVLGQADITTGIRAFPELIFCLREHVVTYPIWVNRLSIDPDPTMEYDAGDVITLTHPAQLGWIDNNKGVKELCEKTLQQATRLGITIKPQQET